MSKSRKKSLNVNFRMKWKKSSEILIQKLIDGGYYNVIDEIDEEMMIFLDIDDLNQIKTPIFEGNLIKNPKKKFYIVFYNPIMSRKYYYIKIAYDKKISTNEIAKNLRNLEIFNYCKQIIEGEVEIKKVKYQFQKVTKINLTNFFDLFSILSPSLSVIPILIPEEILANVWQFLTFIFILIGSIIFNFFKIKKNTKLDLLIR